MPSLRVRHILDGRFALTESISIRFGSPSVEDGGNGKQPRRGALAANGWNVALDVYKRQVLGVAGLVGSRRTELLNTIFGYFTRGEGTMKLHGKEIVNANSADCLLYTSRCV